MKLKEWLIDLFQGFSEIDRQLQGISEKDVKSDVKILLLDDNS